ncbi:hypothetical protein GGI13_003246 [Coemansia sp. RSA 455]|nr:hypothetical protein GGI13_003246 [Coemansia sp. RSA 455]
MSKFTHINLAYAEPRANGTFVLESSYNVDEIADKIHRAGARVLLSLGGYSGSTHLSDIFKSTDSRNTLISGVVEYLKAHNLDGVDIDWVSSECNKVDVPNDANNLLVFVRELRQALDSAAMPSGARRLLALGVGMTPFVGASGQPLGDVSGFANWVDYINVLAYDVNGQQSNTGPNAPLNFEYGRGVQQSLVTAIDNWTQAKFPANQITAGLAFYGRSSTAKTDMSMQPWNVYQPQEDGLPRGDNDDGLWADRCTGKPASYSGVWSYGNLRKQGLLQSGDSAVSPWQRYWDSVSLTPWLFNPSSKVFISYDDQSSISAKVSHVVGKGLKGVTVYDITMDYNNELISVVWGAIKPDNTGQTPPPPPPPLPKTSETLDWPSSSSMTTPTSEPSSSGSVSTSTVSSSSPTLSSSAPPLSPSLTPPPPPLPSPSLPPPATSSPPPTDNGGSGGPQAGSDCGWQASYKCVDKDGKNAQFMQCASGIWVQQQCGAGTACVQNGDYIYCDYPR